MKRFFYIFVFLCVWGQNLGQNLRASELTLLMAGDALLHASVYNDAALKDGENISYDFRKMLAILEPITKKFDLAFYNQETILGGKELTLSTYPRFNSPQEFGDNMLALGFNLVSLANNHTLDRGEKAILASLAYWSDKNVLTAGSYDSLQSRNTPRIYEKNGIKYALLAYTYGTNGIPVPKGKEYLVNVYDKQMLKNDIESLRPQVDLLIVSMHWGIEYDFKPSQEQRDLARYLADLGVDLIIGTHPHVIQPVEWINNTLVYYSLGNMISGQRGTNKRIGMLGAVHISKNTQGKITINNPRAELIYSYYNTHFRDFKLMWLRELDDDILPNYKAIYKQYMGIVQSEAEIKAGLE